MNALLYSLQRVLPLTREWIEISIFPLDGIVTASSPSYEGVD